MSGRCAIPLRAVDDADFTRRPTAEELLAELIVQHDQAEAIMRRAKALIRPLARQWADGKRQLTRPTLDQLRRELGA